MEGQQEEDDEYVYYTEEKFSTIRSEFKQKIVERGITKKGECDGAYHDIMEAVDAAFKDHIIPKPIKLFMFQNRIVSVCLRNIPNEIIQPHLKIRICVWTKGEDTTQYFIDNPVGQMPMSSLPDIVWKIKPRYATKTIPVRTIQKTKPTDHVLGFEVENTETRQILRFESPRQVIIVRGRGTMVNSDEICSRIVINWPELVQMEKEDIISPLEQLANVSAEITWDFGTDEENTLMIDEEEP